MEAVVKSLRQADGDDASKQYSLQALEIFISISPSPKTLSVHAGFLERLVPRNREPIAAAVPISKSPSLCLQGFQLALRHQDLPSLILASLLVLNLNREKVQFKQPFTWESMHLQLAKKLLDARPQSDSSSLCRSLVWHHIHECLSSLEFLSGSVHDSIPWSSVAKKLSASSTPLSPFLEKVVLVCLQFQLEMQEHNAILTSALLPASLSKTSWDSCYRILWKHATQLTSPAIVYHLRKEGLFCLVYAKANWWSFVQQMYKTVMMYEKYSQAKKDALYCEMRPHIHKLHATSTIMPSEQWQSIFLWVEHWTNNASSPDDVKQMIRWLQAECPYVDLLETCVMQLTQTWTRDLAIPPLPSALLPFALRNVKKLVDICPQLPALYNQLYGWSCQLHQPAAQQLLYLRLLIRSCQDTPADAIAHLPRALAYATEETFHDMAERDWYLLAMKWFKADELDAVVQWCTLLAPHYPKCYLMLGLTYQKQLHWAMALDTWEKGVAFDHVPLDKFMQLLYKVDAGIGCQSARRMHQYHADMAPLLAHHVQSVWLVQYRRQRTDVSHDILQYGLSLWAIIEPSSLRRRKVAALADYFRDKDAQSCLETYDSLIQQCSHAADKWVLTVEQHLVARYASLPVQYFDATEGLHAIWQAYRSTELQAGAVLIGAAELHEMEVTADMKAAQEKFNRGDYVDAETKWKQICKEMYQQAYALGLHEAILAPDEPSKMYLQLVHVHEFETFAKVLFSLQQLAAVYMATSRNKAYMYIQYLHSMTQTLDILPVSREVSTLSVQFSLHQGQLAPADAELSQLRANPVSEKFHLKQSCMEDILQGDVHTLAKTLSLATNAYKRAKVKSIPMYPKFQDILALVYRKMALGMPDPVVASQKAVKLSPSIVDHRLALQTLSQALRAKQTREAISQSMHSLQEAYDAYQETKRSIHSGSFCVEYTLSCLESLKYIQEREMHTQLQWRMSWLCSGLPASKDIVTDTNAYRARWAASAIPPDWNIVSLTKYNSNQLLLHRVQNNGTCPVTILLPEFATDKFFKALALLIDRSKETLSGHTAEEAAAWTSSQKKQWWKHRVHLNDQLQLLVEKAQSHLSFYRCLLFPRPAPLPPPLDSLFTSIVHRHPTLSPMQEEILASILYAYSIDCLSDELVKAGLQSCGVPFSTTLLPPRPSPNTTPPGLTLLCTSLHGFPWEGLFPTTFPVSRLSSFAPLFATPVVVSRQSVHYVVNPAGDLIHSEEFLGDFLRHATSTWHWTSSKLPTVESSLASDVFLYCGHGSGEKYIPRDVLPSPAPVALLMGCSSAKLSTFGLYDPEGMLAAYLDASSPAVVGMLWDVTDRDLDRLSLRLLRGWFEDQMSLGLALAIARRECKLPFLNGLAAVCYGLPLVVKRIGLSTTT
ncbi:Aste57867_1050 [Aphanomyces stellatus]|uniref:separase n=1 Tax=Aphanomyces stellatus TaxID=120398 RepID=A0A485K9N8_9STRA|nr:hypothetical protein As57867_001049 [Aphanomyces stellatus]VFT78272.1 Aste57867_1050 [Aphanomyces stellatus]